MKQEKKAEFHFCHNRATPTRGQSRDSDFISAKKLDLDYPIVVTLKDNIQSTKLEHDNTLQGDVM